MTIRQKEILTFLKDYIKKNGYSPTIQDIANYFDLNSVATVHQHLKNLIKGGYVAKDGYRRGYIIKK